MLLKNSAPAEDEKEAGLYVNFKNGEVIVRRPDGGEEVYAEVSGNVKSLRTATRTFRGQEKPYVYLTLTDGDEVYKVGFYADGGTYAGFLMAIYGKGIKKGDLLRLVPVKRGDYTNILVYRGEGATEALKWDKSVQLPTDREAKASFLADLTREVAATIKEKPGGVIYPT